MRNVKNASGLSTGQKVKDFSGTDQNGNKIQMNYPEAEPSRYH